MEKKTKRTCNITELRHGMRARSGISIVEMAIAVMVVGLVVGGVLVAISTIRAAGVQSTVASINTYQKAMATFKDKYNALPGDIPNAETLWGSDTNCPNSPYSNTTYKATCNGNGDGQITGNERFRVWQHLANAGMIPGQYNGVAATGNAVMVPGINVPSPKLSQGSYMVFYQPPLTADGNNLYKGNYGNIIVFGSSNSTSIYGGPILTPAELSALDQKMDDGYPATGVITTSPTF